MRVINYQSRNSLSYGCIITGGNCTRLDKRWSSAASYANRNKYLLVIYTYFFVHFLSFSLIDDGMHQRKGRAIRRSLFE